MVALVESADEDHIVSLPGPGHGVGDQLPGRTALAEVLSGGDSVVLAAGVAYVASFIDHLGNVAEALAYALEGRYLPLNLERGAPSAHAHHLDGVLAHHQYGGALLHLHWKQVRVVLEQHDSFARNLPCGGIMGVGAEAAERAVPVHHGAEGEPEHVAHLGVKLLGAHLSAAYLFEIGRAR